MVARRKPTRSDLISPEVRWYLAERGIPIPDCPPAFATPEPRDFPGARFDPERVDKVLNVFRHLRHTAGPLKGKPLNPDPWQIAYFLAPVFGWVAPAEDDPTQWARIIRKVWVEVPRKNGKTSLAGGLAIYLAAADGEGGAQVYAAAASKDQARFCFNPIRDLIDISPSLKGRLIPTKDSIVHKASGSYFRVISSLGALIHGANVHGAVIDELHVHKNADLITAIETGMGGRRQPLALTITTAGSTSEETVYARRRKRIVKLAEGSITDPSTFGVIWCADAKDDPFVEATWRKANPGLGISPTVSYLASAAAEAEQAPTALNDFLRLHLNVRTAHEERWMPMDVWDASAGVVNPDSLAGQACWAGLDLSQTRDLTAFVMVFPTFDLHGNAGPPYRVIPRMWIPEESVEKRSQRDGVPYDVWVAEGLIKTTPGNVIDFETVETDIRRDAMRYAVQMVAADRTFAWQMLQRLEAVGVPVLPMQQNFLSMSPPTADVLAMAKRGQLHHGGHPILRWMADNVRVVTDVHGNWRPDKSKATEKIDGIVALIMGVDQMMRWIFGSASEEDEVITYDERVQIGPAI